MKLPSWRRWAPTGVAAAAVTALVVALIPWSGPATAAPSSSDTAAPAAAAQSTAAASAFAACQAQPPAPVASSVDYFLKIDGIPGESVDAKHRGEIVVDSFLWGINVDLTACAGARRRPAVADLSITKRLDKSSPKLAEAVSTGKHIPQAVFTARKAGGKGPVEFLVITLKDVAVTSYAISSTGGSFPQDTFNLNFAQIQFVYTPQNADGSAGTSVTFCFNVKANRIC